MDLFDIFNSHINLPKGPVFVTDADPELLYETYLSNVGDRQYHTCNCCHAFIRRFGNLATLTDRGNLVSIWPILDGYYRRSSLGMKALVENANITGVFLSNDRMLGTPEAGGFTHFACQNPNVFKQEVGPAMALMKENFRTLKHGLKDYSRHHVEQAVSMLKTDSLYRSEKVLGPAEFLLSCYGLNDNLLWAKVAMAPVGFCTPRSSMIGTLLDDLTEGRGDFAERFKAKMHPLLYQRPQAAPSVGNLAAAEKFVAENGYAKAFNRRFARFDEIPKIWTPLSMSQHSGPVFGHIKAKNKEPLIQTRVMETQNVTWVRFARDIMPNAIKMQIAMQPRMSLGAMVTATDPDSPWIFQWDNHFNWYVYHGGSTPENWNLPWRGMVDVTGIAHRPWMWTDENKHPNMTKNVMFILDGAKDLHNRSLALFPEIMNAAFHPYRSSIEGLSKAGKLTGLEEASACGILGFPTNVMVTDRMGVVTSWNIDRWE